MSGYGARVMCAVAGTSGARVCRITHGSCGFLRREDALGPSRNGIVVNGDAASDILRVMAWWPEEQWRRMWDGEDCGMCAGAPLATNPFGDLILETDWSYVRLSINQTQAGYSVVIAKRHAPELHHLTPDERCGFWNDVATMGEVIYELFSPVKLANLSMGFRMPHVHCHVLPQYQRDDPFSLLNPQDGDLRLPEAEWAERVQAVRAAFVAAISG